MKITKTKTKTEKTITSAQFVGFYPYRFEEDGGMKQPERIAKRQKSWSALDILNLEEVDSDDKLWVVLRSELTDESILYEFACRCAEEALKLVDNPDQRSVAAIAAKRAWLRGEITDEELEAAWAAAEAAAEAAWSAWSAAYAAVNATIAQTAAWSAAWSAVSAVYSSAAHTSQDGALSIADAAEEAARNKQVEVLIELIEEANTKVEK